MAQGITSDAGAANLVGDYDEICRVVQLCIEGESVDYLSLARIDGTWKIVAKLFAHTGGEPPEM